MTAQNAKNAKPQTPMVFYKGRALTNEETLGLATPPQTWRKVIPLLLSSWLGLLVIVSDPLMAIFTVIAAPVLLSRITGAQRG